MEVKLRSVIVMFFCLIELQSQALKRSEDESMKPSQIAPISEKAYRRLCRGNHREKVTQLNQSQLEEKKFNDAFPAFASLIRQRRLEKKTAPISEEAYRGLCRYKPIRNSVAKQLSFSSC